VIKIKVWCDGAGFNGKRSRCCVAFEDGDVNITETTEQKTNNEMEYKALLNALFLLIEKEDIEFEIFTDSRLIEGQLCKGWRITKEHLFKLNCAVKNQLNELKKLGYSIKITWVPRKENKAGHLLER